VDILLAAAVVASAVAAWTAWEALMVSRLARDTRPLPRRNAAVAGAHRLTVVGQLGLLALAVVASGLVAVPLWNHPSAVAAPVVGGVVTAVLVAAAGAAAWWAARRGFRPQDRRALLAVAVTAATTEVLLRGLGLGLLEAGGWGVTVAVLVTALATGLLQAWRARPGSRAYGFVVATLLGFGLGLLVMVTGSVPAAAAVHVVVAVLGLGRTFPARNHAPGCACGHDHGAVAAADQAGAAPGPAPGAAPSAAASTASTAPVVDLEAGAAAAMVPSTTGSPAVGAHATCGSTCENAGSRACAVCPLSTTRV